jgi:hypothetical protein
VRLRLLTECAAASALFFVLSSFACAPDSGDSTVPGAGGDGGEQGGASGSGTGGSSASGGVPAGGAGGFDIDTGTQGGSGGIDPDAGCAKNTVKGTLIPANLLLVVDRSGSMNCNLPSDGQSTTECEAAPVRKFPALPSKWELTRDGLGSAIDQLQASGNDVSTGVIMFPIDDRCAVTDDPNNPANSGVELLPLDDPHRIALKTYLGAVNPKGLTPIAGSTILAYSYFHQKLLAGQITGNNFVVLLTDGFETCKSDELPKLLAQDVPAAASIGIRTFVIGAPGSEDARSLLSQIAFIGGTAKSAACTHDPAPNNVGDCHFDMTTAQDFGAELTAALAAISGTVLSCELDVPQSDQGLPVDKDRVNVDLNGATIAPDNDPCATANGWQYNADKSKIVLCGTACTDAKKPNSEVTIVLGCPTIPPA